MKVLVSKENHQIFKVPTAFCQKYPAFISGVWAELELSDNRRVIGRCFVSPQIGHIKATRLICDRPIVNNSHDLIQPHAIKTIIPANQMGILIVSTKVQSASDFRPQFLKKCLKGLVIQDGFLMDMTNDEIGRRLGIKYIRFRLPKSDPEEFFQITRETEFSSIQSQAYIRWNGGSRRQKLRIGGLSKQENILKRISSTSSSGFLVSGPPKSGKKSLIKKVFQHDYLILRVPCSSLVRPHPGQTENLLRQLFEKAILHSQEGRTLLLLEDLDLLCGTNDNEKVQFSRSVGQLRTLLDEAQEHCSLVVGATTSSPSRIHPSLRRPGRLTREIFIQVMNGK